MKSFVGFTEALEITLSSIPPMDYESLSLIQLTGRITAEDITSRVHSPSVDASLKDGYAVRSSELSSASEAKPVSLQLTGQVSAGSTSPITVSPGCAVRITTGSPVPQGADAVLSEEFTKPDGDRILCVNTAEKGRNVLPKGTDIRKGDAVARKGEIITPAMIGLFATAGLDGALVYRSPRVCVIATGDEVVAPGLPLPEGKLYASNVTEICAWLRHFNVEFDIAYVKDKKQDIADVIRQHLPRADAFITSGGIWGSEKDMMIRVLETLDWNGLYHRVRMGPGKALAFGLLENKPFFCLPGGPPSNEMAFLQVALPGIRKLAGNTLPPFPFVSARITDEVRGDDAWTQLVHAQLEKEQDGLAVRPLRQGSRLQSMANKNALIILPEGCNCLEAGATVTVQVLDIQALCGF